jgi:hypothetical protein
MKHLSNLIVAATAFLAPPAHGDWREEIILLEGNTLRIFHNPDSNSRPDQPVRCVGVDPLRVLDSKRIFATFGWDSRYSLIGRDGA